MATLDTGLPTVLRLLADATRLRILALLEREELSVGELARTLGMAQSRVSNHLRLLREAGLLSERHVGASTHLRASPDLSHDLAGPPALEGSPARLWEAVRGAMAQMPEHEADLARLEGVRSERRGAEFFDRAAADWDKLAGEFESGQARERAASALLPSESVYADLGCGTGYMGQALLGRCRRLVLVDRSAAMLAEAEKRLARSARGTELSFRQGELDRLPFEDAELDGLVAGMVLHHLADPLPALSEMRRVLKPGAAAAILELEPHREAWMRQSLGDRHLGLDSSDVLAAAQRAGFAEVALDPVQDRYHPPRGEERSPSLSLYLVRARAPRGPAAA